MRWSHSILLAFSYAIFRVRTKNILKNTPAKSRLTYCGSSKTYLGLRKQRNVGKWWKNMGFLSKFWDWDRLNSNSFCLHRQSALDGNSLQIFPLFPEYPKKAQILQTSRKNLSRSRVEPNGTCTIFLSESYVFLGGSWKTRLNPSLFINRTSHKKNGCSVSKCADSCMRLLCTACILLHQWRYHRPHIKTAPQDFRTHTIFPFWLW